jgi:glycosyltransferase involved in cell wall biosynthesis
MTARPMVIYWNNQPTPYVVARFNAVVANGNIDLQAWFDTPREPDRSWMLDSSEWEFPFTYLPRMKIGRMSVPFPDHDLLAKRPTLLISVLDRTAGAMGPLVGKTMGARVGLRTLPVFDTWVTPTLRTDLAGNFLYRAIDGAKISGDQAGALASRFGLPQERMWKVTQSIDLEHYQTALRMDSHEVEERRRQRHISGCTFIYVGRLQRGKGVQYLIDAFRIVQQSDTNVSLLILGDGPDENGLKTRASDLSNVHFVGFVQPAELPEWYALADVFVFPTLGDPNGLVVEEAMASGLPVVSTTNAGDIRKRIEEGITGFVVPPFDPSALSDKMGILAANETLRRQMSERAAVAVEKFSLQNYADDFDAFTLELLETPRRSNPCAWSARALGSLLTRLAKPVG